MQDLLAQGIQLTLLGMGMTFASIGVLVVGMYAMTALTRSKRSRRVPEPTDQLEGGTHVSLENMAARGPEDDAGLSAKRRAAVAAVAVALSESDQRGSASQLQPSRVSGAWDVYVRGRHLSRRTWYDLRRNGG